MVIEINKDIDRYQESVALGLSAKQLIFSAASLICGGGLVLLIYPYIGLTVSAYVAIPIVAPIALGGFYTFNGMSFYDVMMRKFSFMFANKALVYSSSECEQVIREYLLALETKEKGKKTKLLARLLGKKTSRPKEAIDSDKKQGNQEEFEAIKRKTRKLVIGCVVTVVLAVAGAIVYKCAR